MKTGFDREVAQQASLTPATNPAVCSMKVGGRYVVHVIPGWIFTGTVTFADENRLEMKDARYIETLNDGKSVFDLAAVEEYDHGRVCRTSYAIPKRLNITAARVVLFVPCMETDGADSSTGKDGVK